MAKILIVDDEQNIRQSLKSALERRGHDCVTAENYSEGRQFVEAGFDLVLLDVMLPDGNGVDLLRDLHARRSEVTVVMISGNADIETAVEAIRIGAYDFIEKPLSLDRILITIDNATKTSRLQNERKRLSNALYGDLIGESPAIQKLREDISKSAPRTDRFLILGENGTGKELVAHLIHSQSRNAEGPFVAVNCAALPSELVEAELFGHTRGAFTGATKERKGKFQEADGGTIFLDEISEMPAEAQAKILRVLETRKVTPVGSDKEQTIDAVVVAASNRDLAALAESQDFRQDLYYRLNVVTFSIPPLRERPGDVPLLADHFLTRFAYDAGTAPQTLTPAAVRLLQKQSFAGNVREFRNLMERVSIYVDRAEVTVEDISPLLPDASSRDSDRSLKEAVEQFERDYIRRMLSAHGGSVSDAARALGLERSHLYKKMKKLGLSND